MRPLVKWARADNDRPAAHPARYRAEMSPLVMRTRKFGLDCRFSTRCATRRQAVAGARHPGISPSARDAGPFANLLQRRQTLFGRGRAGKKQTQIGADRAGCRCTNHVRPASSTSQRSRSSTAERVNFMKDRAPGLQLPWPSHSAAAGDQGDTGGDEARRTQRPTAIHWRRLSAVVTEKQRGSL